jgi:hypothetical protein
MQGSAFELLQENTPLNWDPNIRSKDLNQLLAFHLEFPRKLSRTRQTGAVRNTGNPLTGFKQVKELRQDPSVRVTKELLKLNRNQLRWLVGLLTGYFHLKGHICKTGLTDSPICERCLQKDDQPHTSYVIVTTPLT